MKNLILTGEISSPDVITTIILLDKDLNILTKDSFYLIKTNSFEYSYEIVKSFADGITDTLYFLRINDEIFKCSPVSYNSRNTFSFSQGILPFNVSDKSWIQKSPILFKKGTSDIYTPIFVNEIDPYYSSVVLFLPMTSDLADYSSSPKTITLYGNTTISNTQSKWGLWSGYFDGIGDYLSIDQNIGFNPESTDFTVELWCFPLSISGVNQNIAGFSNVSGGDSCWILRITSTGQVLFAGLDAGTWRISTTTNIINVNEWNHVCGIKGGNYLYATLNGTLSTTSDAITSGLVGMSSNLSIGRIGNYNAQYFTGYLQDLRITKGVARYTSNFTPPSRIIYTNSLIYSENSTQQIILDNQSVIEWFNYSSANISSTNTWDIGSGILFSFALKKKNSTPINCTFLSRTSYYLIEIMNDVFYINNNVTTLIVSEQFQLFSIWLGPNSTFKTWLNDSPKTYL